MRKSASKGLVWLLILPALSVAAAIAYEAPWYLALAVLLLIFFALGIYFQRR